MTAHAATCNAFATIAHDLLHVHVKKGARFESYTCASRLHFEVRDLAIGLDNWGGEGKKERYVIAVAGLDGVYVTYFECGGDVFSDMLVLPGTRSYPTLCVCVHGGYIAVASMDGRVAVWKGLKNGAVALAEGIGEGGDRVTDIHMCAHGKDIAVLVGWWSGCVAFYQLAECETGHKLRFMWRVAGAGKTGDSNIAHAVMSRCGGSYFAVRHQQDDHVYVARGVGDVLCLHLTHASFLRYKHPDIRGIAHTNAGMFIWSRTQALHPIRDEHFQTVSEKAVMR